MGEDVEAIEVMCWPKERVEEWHREWSAWVDAGQVGHSPALGESVPNPLEAELAAAQERAALVGEAAIIIHARTLFPHLENCEWGIDHCSCRKPLYQWLAKYAAISPEPTQDVPTLEVENDLRREWWINHGHPFGPQYGDDGEMQCAVGSHGVIDFKREPIDDLRTKVTAARLARYIASPAQEDKDV